MPPQGESTGFAIEDAILFAHVLSKASGKPNHPDEQETQTQKSDEFPSNDRTPTKITDLFASYTALRQPTISRAFKEAEWRWETGKESGWLVFQLKLWMTPWFIWWTQERREEEWAKDVRELVP